jgi:hypothetical protein
MVLRLEASKAHAIFEFFD